MDDKSFAGMSDSEKITLLRKELTKMQEKFDQQALILFDLRKRLEAVEGGTAPYTR